MTIRVLRFAAFGVFGSVIVLSSCGKTETRLALSPADSTSIVQDNLAHRADVEEFMQNGSDSPFRSDTTIEYDGLKWFPINVRFRGHSILHRYEHPETVSVFGTKGEERKQLRRGYFEFAVPDENDNPVAIRINVYKFTPYDTRRFAMYPNILSVWFTDKTTGKETYHVGRYVEVGEEDANADHEYTIDLNKAYNPYCAYSDLFSCAIPRKEDHLDIVLRVGEKRYHDDNH